MQGEREVSRFASLTARPLTETRFIFRTTGGFYLLGGLLADLIAPVMPDDGVGNRTVVFALATFAIVAGGLMIVFGSRLRPVYNEYFVMVGIAIISAVVLAATNDVAALAMSTIYVFAAIDAAFFFPWRHALVSALVVALCYLVVLPMRAGLAWWAGLLGTGVTLVAGATTGILARRAAYADIDPLTGLLNRRGFDRLLDAELNEAGRSRDEPALVLFDLDDFKIINDTSGHRVGDAALTEVAATWQQLVQPPQALARYGGDEFALLLPETSEVEALAIADRMRAAISIGCSAGVTSRSPGESASLLFGRADIALYKAKQAGRRRTMLESANLPAGAIELREHLNNLCVYFQPIVRLDQPGAPIVAVEALVRWPGHPTGITALEIIRTAESYDFVDMVDRAVMRRACAEAVVWQRAAGERKIALHVNVSGLSLMKSQFLVGVHQVLIDTGWPSSQLIMEVTESVVDADNNTAMAKLAELRSVGIRIAIDDFGTGYSSLSRLRTLPTDELKLDGSFVDSLSSHGSALLEAVASLGRAVELPMIVEGVEDEPTSDLLTRMGYPMAQGFFFGRPMPLDELCRVFDAEHAATESRG